MTRIVKLIEVGIDEFSNEELILEIERRGYNILENSSKYDLSLVDDDDLIDAVKAAGYIVAVDKGFPSKETTEYIISILPEVKIGSEEYFHQQSIMDFYNGGGQWTM